MAESTLHTEHSTSLAYVSKMPLIAHFITLENLYVFLVSTVQGHVSLILD